MKNLFKNLMLVAVAAMAFTACTETNDEVNATKKETVLKFATSFADTRVTIADEKNEAGEYPVTWDGDEDVRFDIKDGGWWTNLESNKTIDADNRNASFEVILTGYAEGASADEGSTIYGYFGKLMSTGDAHNLTVAGETQTPTVNGVDKSFISMVAEFPVEVEGQMEFVGTFNHKTAYGVITLPASVADVEFKTLTIKVNNANEYILNVEGLDTHSYWFACEPDTVTSISVSAEDSESAVYGYTATGLNKTFVAGTVSKFSIKSLEIGAAEPVQLDAPVVTSSTEGSIATFSWEPVENASSYAVAVNGGEYVNVGDVTEYDVDLSTYAPFSTVYVYVKAVGTGLFLDSYDGFSSVNVPISKDANGDTGFDFTYDSVEVRGTNMYKFYNSAAANEYMYLSFNLDITTLEPGSYTYELYDEVNYGADSAYNHPVYENTGYDGFWLQGTVAVFVDVADDGTYAITVFCKRWVNDGEYLFKGYWTGKLSEEPAFDPDVVATDIEWNSNGYFTLTAPGFDYLYLEVNSANRPNNNSLVVGDYTYGKNENQFRIRYNNGYIWDYGDSTGTMNVSFVDGEYIIIINVTSGYADTFVGSIGYKGMPDGWVAPGEGGDEPVQLATPTATATNITANSITVSWSAVANASNYAVTINGGAEQTVLTTSYTFTGLEAETSYEITVVAKGNGTEYLDSAAATVNATTLAAGGEEPDPSGFVIPGEGEVYELDWRYTTLKYSLDTSNCMTVEQDNGWTWNIRFNSGLSSIEPGDYTAVQVFSSTSALEVDTYNGAVQFGEGYQFFYPDEYINVTINVQKQDDIYCITLIGKGGYNCPATGKYRLVYIGKLSE